MSETALIPRDPVTEIVAYRNSAVASYERFLDGLEAAHADLAAAECAVVLACDGETLEDEDQPRLAGLLELVLEALRNRDWWTLRGLTEYVERRSERRASETSVSARLRDLRKRKFGGYVIERKNEGGGLFQYRLGRGILNEQ